MYFLSRARYTLPNLPLPSGRPTSKSLNFHSPLCGVSISGSNVQLSSFSNFTGADILRVRANNIVATFNAVYAQLNKKNARERNQRKDRKHNLTLSVNNKQSHYLAFQVYPIAPNKLPDYVTNGGHDSYRAFRSAHLDVYLQLEVKAARAGDAHCPPHILLYANTFKWLELLKHTLTLKNRPIRRGRLFRETGARRQQLSRHLKNIQLSLTLPRFLISYWMSVSSAYGLRAISDGLNLTSSMILSSSSSSASGGGAHSALSTSTATAAAAAAAANDGGVLRRSRVQWKVSHVSAQLEAAQAHLYGERRQPAMSANGRATFADNDESFFLGLSRLNYVRESKAGKVSCNENCKRARRECKKRARKFVSLERKTETFFARFSSRPPSLTNTSEPRQRRAQSAHNVRVASTSPSTAQPLQRSALRRAARRAAQPTLAAPAVLPPPPLPLQRLQKTPLRRQFIGSPFTTFVPHGRRKIATQV